MRSLLLLRHAKSSWKDPALDDHERPLNRRGKRDVPRVGRLIAEQGLRPDLVLCSSARRARDTAFALLRACDYDRETRVLRTLYLAGPEQLADHLRRLQAEPLRVMMIGHNPGLEELVEALSGEVVKLPTAGLACLELDVDRWSEVALGKGLGRVAGVWRPRELPEPGPA
jgi:phosphohistidine phosphatase